MNLLQTIISYYHGEARHGFWGAVIGGLLLTGGIMLWKWASPLSLLKGFAAPMLLFGLLAGIGGAADGIYTNRTAPVKIALYQKGPAAFLKDEKVKVEKTHRGWRGIRIFWGILGLSGLVLSFLIMKPFWIGAGSGTLALALILSLFELYSMRFNERYYQAIQSATAQAQDINKRKINTSAQQQAGMQQTAVEPRSIDQKHRKQKNDTLPQQPQPLDNVKTIPVLNIIDVLVSDSEIAGTLNTQQLPILSYEAANVYHNDTGRKILDDDNAEPIQANSTSTRHCLFSNKCNKD